MASDGLSRVRGWGLGVTVAVGIAVSGGKLDLPQTVTLVARIRAVEADAPISHALVTLNGWHAAMTDTAGAVRFEAVPVGPHLLSVRSIGHRPVTVSVVIPPGRREIRLDVWLRGLPVRLEPIEVIAEGGVTRMAREGFFERRDLGFGHFITRAEIDRRDPQRTSLLLVVLPPRFRRSCALWIDGVPAETLGDIMHAVDLLVPPATVQGIEVYSGGANTPVRFNVTRGRCSVVVWTR